MKEQNYKNHSRFAPEYHYVLFALLLVINVLAIVNLVLSLKQESILLPLAFVLTGVSLFLIFLQYRGFALKAQDRAIRAEENLRYFALTGKLFDSRLKMSQIIALRFAPDEEFIGLVDRALNENLSNKDIKQSIKNWRADHHRA